MDAFDDYLAKQNGGVAAVSPTPQPVATGDAFDQYLAKQSTPQPDKVNSGGLTSLITGSPAHQDPSTIQKVAHGPVNGLTGLASFISNIPGLMSKVISPLIEADDLVSPKSFSDAVSNVPNAPGPTTVVPAETLRAPLRGSIMPEDPNWEPKKGLPRIADTAAEYATGALPIAVATDGGSLVPSLLTAATGGAGAGVVRSTMEKDNPAEPWLEMLASIITPTAARGGINLFKGAGIGPTMAGGTDAATGAAMPDKRFLGLNTDSTQANSAAVKALPGGIQAAREARGASLAESDAARKLQGVTLDKPAALENLDKAGNLATGSYLPTSGTVSGDSGLLSIERGVAPQPPVFDRIKGNASAISKGASEALAPTQAPGFGQPADAQDFLGSTLRNKTALAKGELNNAEMQANTAKADLQTTSDSVSGPADASIRAEASRKVAVGVTEGRNAAKVTKDALYNKVNPDLPVTYDNTRAALAEATKYIGENESPHPLVEKMKLNRGGEGQSAADSGTYGTATIEGADTAKTPFWKMQSDLRAVNGALKTTTPGTPEAFQLSTVKTGLLKDIDNAAKGDPALAEANAHNATEYAPNYKEGASQKVLSGKTDSSLAIDEYMSKPQGARQLSGLVKKGDVDPADVRDWFVSKLASSGKPTPQTIQKFVNKNGEILAQFPDIKNELTATQKGLAQKSDIVSKLSEDVAAKQSAVDESIANQTKSVAGKYASQDHQAFMDENLYKQGAMKNLQPLIDEAKMDPSGAALEGLKNSVRESVGRKITNVGRVVGDVVNGPVDNADLPTSLAKAINITRKGSPTREVMESLFTPKEMSDLDQIGAQMQTEMKRSDRVTTGSNTYADKEAGKVLTNTPWSLAKVLPTRILAWSKDVFSDLSTKDREAAYNKMIVNAVLDPKIAAALLRRPSVSAVPQLRKVMAPYLQSGVEFENNTQKNDN